MGLPIALSAGATGGYFKWEIPKGHEARVQGREWSTKPFEQAKLTSAPRAFRDTENVLTALDQNAVELQEVIDLRLGEDGSRRITTAGRVVFNQRPFSSRLKVINVLSDASEDGY